LLGAVGDAPGSSRFDAAGGSSRYQNPDEEMGRLDLNAARAGEEKSTTSTRPTFTETRRSWCLPFAFRGAACLAASASGRRATSE
jgi:hypothetical protein